jgi:hypothetical protein
MMMLLTYFCKRGRHSDCPKEWPLADSCIDSGDCSFNIIVEKCKCSCHLLPE